jgi:hypothetical protein
MTDRSNLVVSQTGSKNPPDPQLLKDTPDLRDPSGDPTRLNDLVSFIASGFRALAKSASERDPEPDADRSS